MSEETEAMSDEMDEPFADEPSGDERKSHGPGLRLGIIVGLIAGAVVATLFAPPTGEETSEVQDTDEEIESPLNVDVDAPLARMRSLIEHVRARMRQASQEAELATREAEELALARYAELTHQDKTTS